LFTLPRDYSAIVVGANGGLGLAFVEGLQNDARCSQVERLSRHTHPDFDITDESAIKAVAQQLIERNLVFHMIIIATGALTINENRPEKSMKSIDPETMAQSFAINAIGPALLLKHFAPLLPTAGKCIFAVLSARVGSIGDNRLGGWYAYRASKAALNQVVHTASIELARKRPDAVCVCLHPGTVETRLSSPYSGRFTHSPTQSANQMLQALDQLAPKESGQLFDYRGNVIPW
jgi:NAD(P)-dependent dehydrogenase (short-subunit alcohol dehydrogenase family)